MSARRIFRDPRFFQLAFLVVCSLVAAVAAHAEESAWRGSVPSLSSAPPRFIVVDKSRQRLQLVETYDCTTGQRDGPKQLAGDLRTPEGVYFVVGKVSSKLDYDEYGGAGYSLNYPNPIDRLLGRTGSGIWIHGRGRAISPRETRGCAVLGAEDIRRLGTRLEPGTPVILGDGLDWAGTDDSEKEAAEASLIVERTRAWNAAWAARSSELFEFYDAEAYAKAQSRSFASFRREREREFAQAKLSVTHGRIQTLRGPGYRVSWFPQTVDTKAGRVEGIRRLYWIEHEGKWLIAGMEWVKRKSARARAR